MGDISVSDDFSTFCDNLRIPDTDIDSIRSRYHAITKRINTDYWYSSSDTAHSLYVGSYGRGTCIYTSDVDIVVDLPWTEFQRFDGYTGNKQSALLREVRLCLQKTYSASEISADGQVVDIDFNDGIKFEIVPAFKGTQSSSYLYPDTNNGGTWKSMDPRIEMDSFDAMNKRCNGNLKNLAKMVRSWNSYNDVFMKGALIDSIAYRFLSSYKYSDKSFTYYDWMSRDFFKYLYDNSDQSYWHMPGSNIEISKVYSFSSEAKTAYDNSVEAISCFDSDYSYSWHNDWRKIYGPKFPEA